MWEDALEDDGTGNPDLSQGNPDGDIGETKTLTGDGQVGNPASLSSLVSAGADENVTFSLVTDQSALNTASTGLTSNGDAVTYSVSGDTLTATAGGREVFTLTVNSDGTWSFDLNDQLDHEDASGDDSTTLSNGAEALHFTNLIEVTDADGDTVNLGTLAGETELFSIAVENDVPELTSEAASGSAVVSGRVYEDALSTGSGELSDGISDNDGATEVTTVTGDGQGGNPASLSSLVNSGADEPLTFELITDTGVISSELGALTSKGDGLTYAVTGGSDAGGSYDLLTATSDGSVTGTTREVFTLKVYEDGDWEYHLNDQVDHSGSNDDDDLMLSTGAESLNFTGLVTVTDADDDTVNLKGLDGSDELFTVSIENDLPELNTLNETFTAKPVDTNLVIIIDVSNSMNNTVGEKTRLEIAQEAVKDLIDEYDKIGDVKVQIVTFSYEGEAQTSSGDVWLDPDDAKTVVDGLSASGGTNYDAALQESMDSYGENGKISSPQAQNVVYFMSDGKPTFPSRTFDDGDEPQHGGGGGSSTENEDGIQLDEQAQWEAFLKIENIDAFAIGVGSGVSTGDLEPIAYNGREGVNRDAVVVENEDDLSDVLLSTVEPDSISGNLVEGYGADEKGYVKSITIDGRTYTYDPDGDSGNGSISVSGGTDQSTFDTTTNTLTISTANSGELAVNMDTGEYVYTSPTTVVTTAYTETITYQASDSDGDVQSMTGTITVEPPTMGTSGSDILNGGSHSDYIMGRDGNDTLSGNGGGDVLIGGGGSDVLSGGEGDDILVFDTADTIDGGADTDTLFVRAGESVDFTSYVAQLSNLEIIQLDIGARILGLSQSDVSGITDTDNELKILGDETSGVELDGSWNVDSQVVEDGVAFNVYTSGSTTVKVQDGVYLLTIDGSSGSTVQGINSGSEDDWLIGNNGNDTLNGGAGDDLLDGGAGNDSLYGNAGDDILLYDAADSVINGGSGVDILRLDNGDNLDFSGTTLSSKITDIEIIDMDTASGEYGSSGNDYLVDDNKIENLRPEDVIDITDGDNTLYIFRGIADIVDLDGFTSLVPDQNVTLNGETYVMDQYTGTYNGVQATVYIQDGYQDPGV